MCILCSLLYACIGGVCAVIRHARQAHKNEQEERRFLAFHYPFCGLRRSRDIKSQPHPEGKPCIPPYHILRESTLLPHPTGTPMPPVPPAMDRTTEKTRRSCRTAACTCRSDKVGRAGNGVPRGCGRRLFSVQQVSKTCVWHVVLLLWWLVRLSVRPTGTHVLPVSSVAMPSI